MIPELSHLSGTSFSLLMINLLNQGIVERVGRGTFRRKKLNEGL